MRGFESHDWLVVFIHAAEHWRQSAQKAQPMSALSDRIHCDVRGTARGTASATSARMFEWECCLYCMLSPDAVKEAAQVARKPAAFEGA